MDDAPNAPSTGEALKHLATRESRSVHLLTVLLVGIVLTILYLARNVLGPYLLGMLIAYMLLPLVRFLESRLGQYPKIARFARPIAIFTSAFLALLAFASVLALVLKPVVDEVQYILRDYETYWRTIQTEQDGIRTVYFDLVPENIRIWIDANLGKIGGSLMNGGVGFLQWLFLTSGSLASAVVAFFAVPLFMIYYLLDEQATIATLRKRLPAVWANDLVAGFRTVDRILGSYTRGVMIESIIVGIITGVGYWIIGVHLALPLGIIAFAGEIVPIIGPWIAFAISFPVVLATQPELAIPTVILFLVVQIVEGWVLAPRIRARSVDFTASGTLLLIAIGGAVAGAIGIVFALPAAAILRSLAIYAYHRTTGYEPDAAYALSARDPVGDEPVVSVGA